MISFSLLYLIPVMATLLANKDSRNTVWFPWLTLGVAFSLVIGFRYQVGGDWYAYLDHYDRYRWQPLIKIISSSDPGYAFVNWLSAQWSWGINGVNLICGAFFMCGLIILCRQQKRAWLGLAVAVPYVLVVVAMGYTRQSVALGFLFLAIAYLERGYFNQFLFFIACGALFHKTALMMIPLGLLLNGRGRVVRGVAVLLCGYVLWDLLLAEQQADLWHNYVDVQMESSGAKIRVLMNFVPAVLFLLYRKRWKETYSNYGFWLVLSLGALLCVVLVDFASTAVDRVALYLTPLQIVVLSRLPDMARRQISPRTTTITILLVYGLVLFVWLNFGTHAKYWLPYRNWLFL